MKNKLAQLQVFVSKIDRRHIQLAYIAFILVGFVFINTSPSDGSGGPF